MLSTPNYSGKKRTVERFLLMQVTGKFISHDSQGTNVVAFSHSRS